MRSQNIRNTFVKAAALAPGVKGLKITGGKAGFFGEVFVALNGLRQAEKTGLSAKIRWGAKSQYYEDKYGKNVWTYYFKQSDFKPDGKLVSKGILLPYKPGAYDFDPYEKLSIKESVGAAFQKWCQPKADIWADVQDFAKLNFTAPKILGVHVRFTDAAAGHEGRKTVKLEDVFVAVDNWLGSHDGTIFLASDDQTVVERFIDRYPGRVSRQDCIRSTDGRSIHGHYDEGVEGSPYQKGREVLIDALLLAQCDHLIRTHSRVTCFTLCWNTNLTYTDLEQELLGENRTPWLHNDYGQSCIS